MSASSAAAPRPQVAISDFRRGRVLAITDHTLPIVHFTLAWRHGALSDPKERPGALAMLLPMLLRGTKRQSRAQFHAALEQLGSSLDTSVGFELAMVRGACLRVHLQATLSLLSEALAEPALAEPTLADLQQEVSEGLANERDDDDTLADIFLRQRFYEGTPLARGAAGSRATLGQVSRADLAQARAHLCAPWALLAMAGSIDLPAAEAAAGPLFSALAQEAPAAPARPKLPQATHLADASSGRRPRFLLVDKPERTQAQVRIALPGLPCSHRDNDAFWLGTVAFGGTFTSPLTREVRDQRGWSYTAHADYRRRSMFASPLILRTAPANADAGPCVALELALLTTLAEGNIELSDLVRARNYLVGRAPFWSATAFDLLGPAMLLDMLKLPLAQLHDSKERLLGLALSEVPTVLQRHLALAAPEVVIVGSQAALLAPLQAHLGAKNIEVVAYTEGL